MASCLLTLRSCPPHRPPPISESGYVFGGRLCFQKGQSFYVHSRICTFTYLQSKKQMVYKPICASVDSEEVTESELPKNLDVPPPGCSRVTVELNKPLGIMLEEDKNGNIFVAEVFKNGNAERSGLVDVGDQLIATSAIVYGSEDYYQGVKVRKGMQIVRLTVFGEKFETVMAAIGTHPAHVKVTLEIQKCKRTTNGAADNPLSS